MLHPQVQKTTPQLRWYLVTQISHYKKSFPICSTPHLSLYQMPSNSESSPTVIPSYRQVLLDEIDKSWEILTFDPLEFELKPFFWYVLLYWLSRRLKTKTRGQACGWQQTCHARHVARVSRATQIRRTTLLVSTFTDDQRRTSLDRSWSPAQGLRRSHRGIHCRMPEWTLRIFWWVACCVPKEIVNVTKKQFL